MQLKEDVACVGEQCAVGSVRIVKVDVGYFEYVPPTCVHMFFYEGRVVTSADKYFVTKRTCENPDVRIAGASCCAGCKDDAPAVVAKPCQECTGTGFYKVCDDATRNWAMGDATSCSEIRASLGDAFATKLCNNSTTWTANKFCALTCYTAGAGYTFEDDCSLGAHRGEQMCAFHSTMRLRAGSYRPPKWRSPFPPSSTRWATRSPCASVRLSPVEPATNRGPIRQSWWSLWPAVRIHSTCWCR